MNRVFVEDFLCQSKQEKREREREKMKMEGRNKFFISITLYHVLSACNMLLFSFPSSQHLSDV